MYGMGIFSRAMGTQPSFVTINQLLLECLFCRNETFVHRQVQMNTAGMELFDLGWANKASDAFVCASCGYVHEFMGGNHQLYEQRPTVR
jgi:predicted nucleic-acid-binding Zn-ribbon protein